MFLVIGGATASGKSELAIRLAEELNGEIISADSMQIYREMNIGTAKITQKEMRCIPHHMIDVVEPWENYSLSQYQESAKKCIKEITERGHLPIICGGTGLYINALIYDYNLSSFNDALRKELLNELETNGIDFMYSKLLDLDPLAKYIHKNNHKRVIRALEAIIGDGKSILEKTDKNTENPHLMYALNPDRAILYERINRRVDVMFEKGLMDEVDYLLKTRNLNFDMQSMQAIGYREFKNFYDVKCDIETLKDEIKKDSRRYAKRQLTWFKRINSCQWLDCCDFNQITGNIKHDYYNYISNLKQ